MENSAEDWFVGVATLTKMSLRSMHRDLFAALALRQQAAALQSGMLFAAAGVPLLAVLFIMWAGPDFWPVTVFASIIGAFVAVLLWHYLGEVESLILSCNTMLGVFDEELDHHSVSLAKASLLKVVAHAAPGWKAAEAALVVLPLLVRRHELFETIKQDTELLAVLPAVTSAELEALGVIREEVARVHSQVSFIDEELSALAAGFPDNIVSPVVVET